VLRRLQRERKEGLARGEAAAPEPAPEAATS
jgi:hypothetical protein